MTKTQFFIIKCAIITVSLRMFFDSLESKVILKHSEFEITLLHSIKC